MKVHGETETIFHMNSVLMKGSCLCSPSVSFQCEIEIIRMSDNQSEQYQHQKEKNQRLGDLPSTFSGTAQMIRSQLRFSSETQCYGYTVSWSVVNLVVWAPFPFATSLTPQIVNSVPTQLYSHTQNVCKITLTISTPPTSGQLKPCKMLCFNKVMKTRLMKELIV